MEIVRGSVVATDKQVEHRGFLGLRSYSLSFICTIMVDTCYYTFVQTPRMYNTRVNPHVSYGLWVTMTCPRQFIDSKSVLVAKVCWGWERFYMGRGMYLRRRWEWCLARSWASYSHFILNPQAPCSLPPPRGCLQSPTLPQRASFPFLGLDNSHSSFTARPSDTFFLHDPFPHLHDHRFSFSKSL